jgi:hypothetical protein
VVKVQEIGSRRCGKSGEETECWLLQHAVTMTLVHHPASWRDIYVGNNH